MLIGRALTYGLAPEASVSHSINQLLFALPPTLLKFVLFLYAKVLLIASGGVLLQVCV